MTFGSPALLAVVVGYLVLALVTVRGSRRRGNPAAHCVADGLAWPAAWVRWFVSDNRAAGRGPFRAHER